MKYVYVQHASLTGGYCAINVIHYVPQSKFRHARANTISVFFLFFRLQNFLFVADKSEPDRHMHTHTHTSCTWLLDLLRCCVSMKSPRACSLDQISQATFQAFFVPIRIPIVFLLRLSVRIKLRITRSPRNFCLSTLRILRWKNLSGNRTLKALSNLYVFLSV